MAQQIINIGSDPGNLGDGDSLRDAFRKTQDNFDELFSIGPITDTSLDHSDPLTPGTIAYALNLCDLNGGGTVKVGPGEFSLNTESLRVGPNCRLTGSGKGATRLKTTHAFSSVLVGYAGLGQLAKWEVSDLTIYLNSANTKSALNTIPAESTIGVIRDVMIEGGAQASWGITIDAANIIEINGVTYRGEGSGIRWVNLSRYNVNYGDSIIYNTDIYLNNSNVTGIQIASPVIGVGAPLNLRMNNMLLSRVEVIAKNGVLQPGTVGLHLRNTARITLLNVDLERVDTALLQESEVSGGAIATSNAFIQVYALGCNQDYVEVGTPVQQTIIGGHGQFSDEQRLPGSDITCYNRDVGYNRVLAAVRPIVNHSDSINPLALTTLDSGKIFTNKGASGTVTFILPDLHLANSMEFEFHLATPGSSIQVYPGASSLIRPPQSSTGVYYESDVSWGQVLSIRSIDGSTWSIINQQGTWT